MEQKGNRMEFSSAFLFTTSLAAQHFPIMITHCLLFLNGWLDFVLQYARKGELLYYLNKLSSFDMKCSRFYAAEMVVALEYLQQQGVIHRYI